MPKPKAGFRGLNQRVYGFKYPELMSTPGLGTITSLAGSAPPPAIRKQATFKSAIPKNPKQKVFKTPKNL